MSGYSVEVPYRGASNEYPQPLFFRRSNLKNKDYCNCSKNSNFEILVSNKKSIKHSLREITNFAKGGN